MAKGHFIRLGDKTTCGGTVLEADHRIMIFGIPHSREGDQVSCGKDGKIYAIEGGIPSMMSHGQRMAGTLDSFSSCPCQARLIASIFTASYASRQDTAPRAVNRAAPSDNSVPTTSAERSTPSRVEPRTTSIQKAAVNDMGSTSPIVCPHPDQMEELASYIADEMNRNIGHPSVIKMRKLNSYDAVSEYRKHQELPWYARLTAPNFQAIELSNMGAAMAIWTSLVGQNMQWDHKPKIRSNIGGIFHKQGEYEYFYDIWSNIHYGYVGVAGGLSESLLLDGAGVEQIVSDSIRKIQKWDERDGPHRSGDIDGMRAWDDAPDRISITIGMELYQEYPNGGLTAKIIMDKVLAIPPADWAKGIQEHVCK